MNGVAAKRAMRALIRGNGVLIGGMLAVWGCSGGSSNPPPPPPPPGNVSVAVSPQRTGATLSQTINLTATVTNDVGAAGVSWSATGGTLSGKTLTAASFSSSSTGSFTITATSNADNSKTATATIGVTDLTGVLTAQNDVQRTGQNLHEFAMTPANVGSATFGKLYSCSVTENGTVPGHVYAQPLYVANLTMSDSKKHNVLYVATESDFVYAFDADANPCQQLWKANLLSAAYGANSGETTIPAADTGEADDLHPEIGATSTPAIDLSTNTMYLCAKSKESNATYHARLHAIDLVTGAEKAGSPVDVSFTGFDPLIEAQRPALLLSGNNVYLGFGSHGDNNSYHGYLVGYDKATLAQTFEWAATDTSVGSSKGGIWQAGAGPAVDSAGDIWVEIANGDFDGSLSFGDSVVRVNPAAASPVADFFTPKDQDTLRQNDIDLGSGGVTILPDGLGSATQPHLAIATGKTNLLYLLDQSNLGQFSSSADNVIQEVTLPNGLNESAVTGGMFSKAAYFNGRIYVAAISDVIRAFSVGNAMLTAVTTTGAHTFGYPGATPSISGQGSSNGIVWLLDTTNNNSVNGSGTAGPAQLFAYDAGTMNLLYSSPTSGTGAAATAVKFTVPTIANGKVYVGGEGAITVFGLLP
ncbi:MAG TPA: hypothetical protein VJN93_11980 [Candidatus Acidoferrum sp.]|nr:hypothetical protein [Candidatus Acidoferrum sp.]